MNARILTLGLPLLPSLLPLLLAGCGATSASIDEAHEAQRAELEVAKRRAQELEAELSARRAEIRQLESELALLQARRPSSTRIERRREDEIVWDEPPVEEAEEARRSEAANDGGPRVSLKLYGDGERQADRAIPSEPPPGPAPIEAEALALSAGAPPAPPEPRVGGFAYYRKALAEIREKRLESALPLLELAIEHAASNAHRIDAVYWRGEVLYLLGRHLEAEVEFASIVSAEVEHDRVPSSLLRLGQCRKLRGLDDDAEAIFEKLRGDYPGSHAAAQAPREGV